MIVFVPKKNGKIRVCVDYRELNAATMTDVFPLPFTDGILDAVAGHEIYSFLDGFSGYNQLRMHPNLVIAAETIQKTVNFMSSHGIENTICEW